MQEKSIDQLSLDGGCLVFDFTNTIGSRHETVIRDYLQTYADFLKWVDRLEVVPKARLKELITFGLKEPARAHRIVMKIIAAREIIYSLFSAIALRKKPEASLVAQFNKVLGESLSHLHFNISPEKNEISFAGDKVAPDEPMHIILKSAFDVLTLEDPSRIKECPSCGWLFLDKTKNSKRRWCNMQDCGSKDKALRYYHRKKEQEIKNK